MGLYEIAKQQAKIEGYDIDESLAEANAKRHIGRLESRAGTTTLTGQELSSLTNGASYEDVSSMIERPWNPLHENIPYLMAENQSVGAKIGGFANQLQGEIIGGAIEGFGYLGDVAHWGDRLSGGEGDWGNWLSDVGTSYKDLTRDLTPIYQHHPGEAFDPGDFGWWMSNAVSVGSSLSLLIPAAGATMALGKLGKMTGMLDKAVKLGSKLGLAAESTKMLGTVMGRAMFSRHMENMMEANGTFDEIKNKQLQLGKSEEEATRLASGGAADVYRNNWPLVIQDIAQMALIAKGPNFTKAVDSAAVATAAGMSAKGALLKAGYTKGWDMLTEGAEEAYQFVVGEEAKYSVDVATGLKPKSNFGDRLGEYAKDGHLWTSALFGALGAGVMQAAGPLVNKLTSGEYNPETAARVEEIKTRGVTYAAASKLYREAANADSKEGIEHASDFMALDLVTRAEATGNLDLQFKQLDDFKTMSKEERAAENFDEGMVERIDDIKSRMQEIVEMSKNIRKTHDPLVRYNVAMRMLQNKRFNKTLQESKVNESVNTNAIPRHSDLSSFGKSSLNDILDLNAVNSAIAATSQMLQGNITDFAKSKLEQTLKNYEAKRDAIAAKLDSEEANTNITEEDRKIIDSYQNSPFVDKVIVDKVKTIIAKDAIDRNNEEIAHLGSKEGIEDYKRVVAKARKKQADKDAKDAQDKLDADNAAADALVKAKSKEEELGKLTTELTPSDEELLKSMPEGHLIGKTDAELQAIADKEGLELSDVKVWQQADIEAFNKLKEQAANTAKTKAKEKLAEASKTNDEFIPTADNTTQIDFTESLPERESPKITTGHALAWKSSGNATSSELDKLNNKELSNFLEDPNIDLSAYDVVFSIDEEKLEKESKYEGIAEQLAAGNFENIGEVPVKGVFHLNGVPVLSPSDKPYTVYIHDSTYEYFAEQHREDAIAEAIALKTAVVAAKPGTTISTKIVNKSKGHLNVDKQGNKFIFHSLAESINDKSDKLEFAVGGNGGIYLNTAENKDIHNSLVGLLSARPGAVYTLVKTANGKVVPIRTWVSKLDEQEATLLYNTYKDILNKPQEYQNKLSKEFKEANASILTSLPINTATITYKELLEFFVFEGALTKDMGGRQLYTTKDGTLHIAGEVIDIQTMNTPEGMTKFVDLITAGNFRQISRTRLANNSYKEYVAKNNILTTNVIKVNNNIFVQPTLTIGTLESNTSTSNQQNTATSTLNNLVADTFNNDFTVDSNFSREERDAIIAGIKEKIKQLPEDMVFLMHLSSNEAVANIAKTGLNTGVAIESTTNLAASKKTLEDTLIHLVNGNINHRGLGAMIIIGVPKSMLNTDQKLNQSSVINSIEDYLAENNPEAFGHKIPADFNVAAFINGKLVIKDSLTTAEASSQNNNTVNKVKEALKVLNSKTLRVNPNDSDTYIDEEGNIYDRVSTLNGKKTFTNTEALDRGTIIDSLLREYISGNISSIADLKSMYSLSNKGESKPMDDTFIEDLYNIFKEISSLTKNLEIISTIPTLWGTIFDKNVAGTIDLLAIDKVTGDVFIIDLKTSTRNRRDVTGQYYESNKKSDSSQQSAYAELLYQRTGIRIKNVVILPIQVFSKYGKYTSALPNKDDKGNFTQPVLIDRSIFKEQVKESLKPTEEVFDAKAALEQSSKATPQVSSVVSEDVRSKIEELKAKKVETEAKIKRKDLFIGVGEFSKELGGSNKAAEPVSHKEINGIEFVEYAHPDTGSIDVIVTGKSHNNFVGFYRIYENGKPTNKWSSKFENQSRNKEDFKTMISGVQEMLPQGHEYTEKTSISTDGLRVWAQQLNRGYELQYDKNGKLITNLVAINGDAIINDLGISVEKGEFENIKVKSKEEFEIVKKALLPYLEKLGLGENDVRWLTGTVKINLPVLKSNKESIQKTPQQSEVDKIKAEIKTLEERLGTSVLKPLISEDYRSKAEIEELNKLHKERQDKQDSEDRLEINKLKDRLKKLEEVQITTTQQSTEDVISKIEELKAKLAKARSIKSKAKIQEELDALEITETTKEVVQPIKTATRDLADSLFPELTNLNDNQITKAKMRILWNANKDIIIKKWGVESFDKFYNLAKLDPKVTEWTINNCK